MESFFEHAVSELVFKNKAFCKLNPLLYVGGTLLPIKLYFEKDKEKIPALIFTPIPHLVILSVKFLKIRLIDEINITFLLTTSKNYIILFFSFHLSN